MQRECVLASGNRGKLREIKALLKTSGVSIRPQSDWQVPEASENASTFVENALTKARQAARYTGLASIADDSGLVVPSLGGAPGIYSARYAGTGADDQANMSKLLLDLHDYHGVERDAYFYCATVLLESADDPDPLIATGCWPGRILTTPQGDGGFGYDPVFGVSREDHNGGCRSAAELTSAEKSRVSHRGQALRELVRLLETRDGWFAD